MKIQTETARRTSVGPKVSTPMEINSLLKTNGDGTVTHGLRPLTKRKPTSYEDTNGDGNRLRLDQKMTERKSISYEVTGWRRNTGSPDDHLRLGRQQLLRMDQDGDGTWITGNTPPAISRQLATIEIDGGDGDRPGRGDLRRRWQHDAFEADMTTMVSSIAPNGTYDENLITFNADNSGRHDDGLTATYDENSNRYHEEDTNGDGTVDYVGR